ncbi:MAG: XRE family transcriptional regulator [Bacilli bacterium]|nr:XRE family transcriptional regulator [Bacilli bacterium]
MKKTVGDNLKLYRMRSNLSMSAAGKILNMSAPAILKYERNQIIASLKRLEDFALAYNTTIEDLLDVEDTIELKFTNFKCKPNTSEIKKLKIKDLIISKVDAYFNLLKLSEITFQNKFGVHMVGTLKEAESLATKLRIFFTVPIKDPISNLVYLLENNNMMIITIPRNDVASDFIGFYETVNNVPVIAVPEAEDSYEQRFSIAKYLGELLIINDYNKDALTTQFALSLLIPRESIIEEFDEKRIRISFREIEIFSNNFRVSYKHIIRRLKEIGIITSSNAKYLNIHINKNNIKENEYYEVPYFYEKLKAKLTARGIIK